jgi:uncharacterized DUF497 family protein
MRFAWNEKKAAWNLVRHGISFEEASTVFGDPLSDTFPDHNHSLEEQRFIIIGASESGKILVVAHTDDGELARIISAREATARERTSYEEN